MVGQDARKVRRARSRAHYLHNRSSPTFPPMPRTCAIAVLVAGLFAGVVGCHSMAPQTTAFHARGWEDANDAKAHLEEYNHILLACVYEDHWEDRGPHSDSAYHCKATVVRVYKGDGRTAERVSFVEGLDYPAPTTWNSKAGGLVFLFINEHTNSEIGLDPGYFSDYDAELERLLQLLFPAGKSR